MVAGRVYCQFRDFERLKSAGIVGIAFLHTGAGAETFYVRLVYTRDVDVVA